VSVFGDQMFNDWTTEGEWLVSPRLDAPDGVSRVGVLVELVEAGAIPRLEARSLEGDRAGRWTAVTSTWGEEDTHVGTADVGLGEGATLRILASDAARIRTLRWNAVIPEVHEGESGEDLGATRDALRTELTGIGITSREAWGARATRCTSRDASRVRFAIHHTVSGSTDPLRQVRGIQNFHMDSNGWCDVGYHFLVGIDGTIYEGRPVHLLGAHVANENTGNIGISFVGCFHSSGCAGLGPSRPPQAMIDAAGRLIGTLSRLYGITVSSTTVRGHRDHPGQSTSCPGDYLRARIVDIIAIGRTGTLGGGSPAPAPPSSLPAIEVYWSRGDDGAYALRALAPAAVSRVVYRVDGFVVGRASRADGPNFPTQYTFATEASGRLFEVIGLDDRENEVAYGNGRIDTVAGTAVFVKQLGAGHYEIGLERAPAGVTAIEVRADGFLLTDEISGATRSSRLEVRSRFMRLGNRSFEITTYAASGAARGTLRRALELH
ncbi:MAG: N-acetylmuramoyl-L-alanine amidase, partial [Deltaproteobacteria bacterium]